MAWPAPIIDAIIDARLFLLVFSENTNDAQQVARELQLARDRHLPILAVMTGGALPEKKIGFHLRRHRTFDASPPPLRNHLTRLAEEVRTLLGERRAKVRR